MIQAFYNDTKLKEKYVNRVKKHYKLDEIKQGIYWENGKGCAVGCTMEISQGSIIHKEMEKQLGIPESLALLEDRIFEGLPNGEAKEFPLKFLEAITPGADLSKVTLKFKIWLLTDKHNGIQQWANEETKKIIKQIVKLQEQELKGKDVDYSAERNAAASAARNAAWSAERNAAWSAERNAAWSAENAAASAAANAAANAAWNAAANAAWNAAWSAESAAWSAAWSAESAAWSAARSAQYKAMAEKLLSLLKETK